MHRDAGPNAVLLTFDDDGQGVQRLFILVHIQQEIRDAAGIIEGNLAAFPFALVHQMNGDAANQKGELSKPAGNAIEMQIQIVEYGGIGQIGDFGASLVGCAGLTQGILRLSGMQFAAFKDRGILLLIDFSAEINLDFQPFGKRIDNAGPDAMQAARKGIALIIELSARVQLRKDNLYARDMRSG